MFAERWTIDEIGDGAVRVLAARSLSPDTVARLIAASPPPGGTQIASSESGQVLAIELGTAEEGDSWAEDDVANPNWTDEEDCVLDAAAVSTFVERFMKRPLDVEHRPLRETDVFWVVARVVPGRVLSDGRVRRSETEVVLAAYEAVGPSVRDMTLSARQASKFLYNDAFRKSEEHT
jgi:hypothetical protein